MLFIWLNLLYSRQVKEWVPIKLSDMNKEVWIESNQQIRLRNSTFSEMYNNPFVQNSAPW